MANQGLSRKTLLVGMAAAAAVLFGAPAASADPDQQQCPEQQQALLREQQLSSRPCRRCRTCPQQGHGTGQPVDLSDKNCWVVNGVPTMWSPALTTVPGQTATPCYYVYGLTPH